MQIKMQQKCVQQYVFVSTEIYHIFICMVNTLKNNVQYVIYVTLIIVL